jgi:hypothetical protein
MEFFARYSATSAGSLPVSVGLKRSRMPVSPSG